VAWFPRGASAHPTHTLFGDLHREEAPAGNLDVEAPTLPDRKLAPDEVGVILAKPERTVAASRFFVGHPRKDEIALRSHPFPCESSDDGDRHRCHVLHVDGTTAPQATVVHLAAKRRMVPGRGVRLDDIEVCGEKKWRLVPSSTKPGNDVATPGSAL
jgi:hypothetical protein